MAAHRVAGKTSAFWHPAEPEYRILSDLSEVEKVSRQWDSLLAASSCNKAFGSLEWYVASCRVNSPLTPYLVAVGDGSEIDCILPLVLEPGSGIARFPHYGNDYNDVLVRGDNSVQAARLLKYAISHGSCRQLVLSKLRPDSHCIRAAVHIKDEPDILYQYKDIESYSYVELPGSFDSYLESLGKKFRKNTRRALRALEANAVVMIELRADNCDPADLPEVFLRLFLSRHGGRGLFQSEKAQRFTKELLPVMFRKGNLRVFAMLEAGSIVAILLWFVTNTGCLAWNAGFLKEKQHWSPGTCLYAFAIKQAISTGVRELDFGDGDEAYKSHWANDSYRVGELIIGRR